MMNSYLIVSIVRKGWGDAILEATMNAGAHGGTVLPGRGIGRNEQMRVFGIKIEPEKEIILTIVGADLKDHILSEVERVAELNMPGNGLAFYFPLEKVAGIMHVVSGADDPLR